MGINARCFSLGVRRASLMEDRSRDPDRVSSEQARSLGQSKDHAARGQEVQRRRGGSAPGASEGGGVRLVRCEQAPEWEDHVRRG